MSTLPIISLCSINPETLNGETRPDSRFRYLDISAVNTGRIDWAATITVKYSEAPSRARRVLRKGDALLCTVRPSLQSHALITAEPTDSLVGSTGFAVLRPHQIEDASFVFHSLFSNGVAAQLRARETGSSYPAVNERDVRELQVFCPPPDDRTRIAAVLDTADEAIAKTEAVIAKLRQVRTGLIHDLLTCGLDENGHLRDPIAHPEQFKDSPLGSIPKDWTVAPLKTYLSSAEYGISTSLKTEGPLPVLRMNNLAGGEAELSDVKFATYGVPSSLHLREGDVLFNRTNSYEHVGKTCIWRSQLPVATFASYLVRLNPAAGKLTSELLNLVLNSPEYQLRMRRFATPAVQQVNINPTSLQKMLVAIPNGIAEQERIVIRAQEAARSIAAEAAELTKLQSIKSGLMDDLLTGRVRVPEAP